MNTLSRLASLTLPIALLAPACASDADDPSSRIRLEAASGDCEDPQQICLETHPPQCYDVCPGDEPPGDGDDCVSSDGDFVECGDDTCIIGTDDDGQETVVCPGPDCSVSYDAETGEETISCPPGGGDDDDGGGGSEPGNPGTGD